MTEKRKQHGMVLMDLLLGLMIGAIVLAAAATMADAMSHGKRATENMTRTSSYLAQLHTRLADLIMRADNIETFSEGEKIGVRVVCEGEIYTLYTDASKNILYVYKESDVKPYKYIYEKEDASDPIQKEVKIDYDGVNRVTITFDIEGVSYTMTAARRGGG